MGDEDSNCKKKQVVAQQSYHFDDLIIQEILVRLPVKSVLRFKSVSKQWCSTLSSSDFANAHLMKSPLAYPSAPVNTLFINSGTNYYLFSYNDDQFSGNFEDNLVKLDIGFGLGVEKDVLQLTGSCNGLVCLNQVSGKYFILWNPATRKLYKYEPDVSIKRIDDEVNFPYISCGFGYASSVDDYKFVRFFRRDVSTDETNYIVHIFSLRENKWTRSDFDFGDDFLVASKGRLTNERLYWPVFCSAIGYRILSFDLVVERFDIIKVEQRLEDLGVMGGCLSMCHIDSGETSDMLMHIFESPGVILKSICFPKELKLYRACQMIGFTKTGKFFVTMRVPGPLSGPKMLSVIDTDTKPMQYTTVLRFSEMINIERYVPSVVSPFPYEKPPRA